MNKVANNLTRVIVFAALLASMASHASTVFDDTGLGITASWYGVGVLSPYNTITNGFLFTPSQSGQLATVEASFAEQNSGSASVTFNLYSNNGGSPGTLLDTLSALVPAYNFSSPTAAPLTTFDSSTDPLLSNAQSYWLVASSSAAMAWYVTTVTAPGTDFYFTQNGIHVASNSTQTEASLIVNTAPVPLPAAAWMMLGGLGGLGVFARKKRVS